MFHDHHYVPDNPIEEIGEAVLQGYSGCDVDFSPNSDEKMRPQVVPIPRK